MIQLRFRFPHVRFGLTALLLIVLSGRPSFASGDSAVAATHDKFVSQYMAGKWDDLEAALKANAKQLAIFDVAQKADIDYITQTLDECYPAWWKQCRTGNKTQIRTSIFKVPVTAVYDPQQKQGLSAQFNGDSTSFALGWPAGDMDSNQQAEHGFTKGELGSGGVWSALGMASGYVQVPMQSLVNSNDLARLKLTRVLDFRGDLAATYYGTPRTRQWWIFLSLHYYRSQYQKSPIVMSRKSLGAMFVAELATHREQYPSIKLPTNLEADDAEEKLVMAVHDRIEKHGWTLAEDKLIREATKAFALANASLIRTGGPVKLANGLQVSLEPKEDAVLHIKRDQWLAQQLATH